MTKAYVAFGYWKQKPEEINCIVSSQTTIINFKADCRKIGFVPYAALQKSRWMDLIIGEADTYEIAKHLTPNHKVWEKLGDYIAKNRQIISDDLKKMEDQIILKLLRRSC